MFAINRRRFIFDDLLDAGASAADPLEEPLNLVSWNRVRKVEHATLVIAFSVRESLAEAINP